MVSRLRRYRLRGGTFWRQSPPVRRAIIEATMLLATTRLAVRWLPFERLERLLGRRLVETSDDLSEGELQRVRTVAEAIRIVSPHTVWTSNCLPQAIAAKLMLRRRGVASTLYVGAAFRSPSRTRFAARSSGPMRGFGRARSASLGARVPQGLGATCPSGEASCRSERAEVVLDRFGQSVRFEGFARPEGSADPHRSGDG